MNARVAKKIRRVAYPGGSPRERAHYLGDPSIQRDLYKNLRGCCVADGRRRLYQRLKNVWQSTPRNVRLIAALRGAH
jgi:hypothetical protein